MTTVTGVVREFDSDEGWGVIDAPEVPGGCWVGFGDIMMEGYRKLVAGQRVCFRYEAVANQDGYRFRAVKVWQEEDPEPPDPPPPAPSDAFSNTLIFTFRPPGDPPAPPC